MDPAHAPATPDAARAPHGATLPDNARAPADCFVVGTRIDTRFGPEPVETLAPGVLVRARFAGQAPVLRIGHRRVDCRRHPSPWKVWPVRVVAGAFGPDLPRSDLLLSRNHAVLTGDVLIPIRLLVNRTSIRPEPMDEVDYHRIELPAHDVLFAEGLPAESFLDRGDRGQAGDGGEASVTHSESGARHGAVRRRDRGVGAAALLSPVRRRCANPGEPGGGIRRRNGRGVFVLVDGGSRGRASAAAKQGRRAARAITEVPRAPLV